MNKIYGVVFWLASIQCLIRADSSCSLELDCGDDKEYQCLCSRFPNDHLYWIDYFGEVPPNAIVAGTKCNGSKVYIGQVYHDRNGYGIGIATVEILEGQQWVHVADNYGIYPQNMMIKILAGSSDIIRWVDTNINTPLRQVPSENTLVPGGYQHYYGKIYEYIGRITNNCNTFVGRAMLDTKNQKVRGLQMIYNKNETYTIAETGFQVLSVLPKNGCVF